MNIRHVEVVVPARNEEERIADCLRSVSRSIDVLREGNPGISCGVTVVADCCTDRTAHRARMAGADVVVSDSGCVGAARHTGTTDAMDRARRAGVDPYRLWIAGTDADSVVPPCWLKTHVALADTGIDAIIGTVVPTGLGPDMDRRWRTRHRLAEGHQHVHGANLGFRASTYCEVGGFADYTVGEDVDLVERIRAITPRWIATHRASVTTSGRAHSRVVGGFASYLSDLDAEVS